MTLRYGDRVLETSTTTGTGAFTLAGAATGYQRFSAIPSIASPSDTVYYAIYGVDGSGVPTGEWETGLGTYSAANTLTRTTVQESSNSNSAVSFSAGTKYVIASPTASLIASLTGAATASPLTMSTAKLLGRTTASTGAIEEVAVSADLSLASTTLGLAKGTSFPGSPATNDQFFRTDRGIEYYYDGTRWLSTQLLVGYIPSAQSILSPHTANDSAFANKPFASYAIYITDIEISTFSTTTTASNYTTFQLKSYNGGSTTNIGTTASTQNDTTSVFVRHTINANAVVASTEQAFEMSMAKTGTISITTTFSYLFRLIG